jgi:hypothetical protein
MLFEIMAADEPPPSLPCHANPATGMVIGLTFLLLCLVGPVALLVPLIAWLVSTQRSRRPQSVELPPAHDEPS